MVSSKKKRGKQRKAVVKDIVQLVKKGDNYATQKILVTTNTIIVDNLDGILSAVFGLLQRCEDETFDKVMTDVGGDLRSPSTWIKVLLKAVTIETNLQVIQNFGPLVKCMCADTERLFFKSNKYWKESIVLFVELLSNIIHVDTVDALLQHHGLLRSIVQWGFWGDGHRPDILREIGIANCARIVSLGRESPARVTRLIGKNERILNEIATTPIVSKDYDITCRVSYVVGLIRRMKAEGWMYGDLCILDIFVAAKCVDKDVIMEVVDFGLNYPTEFDNAACITKISFNMTLRGTNIDELCLQSDTRIACAIRAGLIEMCLSFIEQFGRHESFGSKKNVTFYECVHDILRNVSEIALHKKTAKAIHHKRQAIEEKLVRLVGNTAIASNTKCKKLLDMVVSILNIQGAYCCWCNKPLGRKERKQCDGCNRMTYCSKACQKEDWVNGGHKLSCCKPCPDEQAGQFQGRIELTMMPNSERDVEKLTELEINITNHQLKLFLDNSETILSQAKQLGLPLHDCVVTFDLRQCPSMAEVMKYTEVDKTLEESKAFEDSRSTENITCIFLSEFYYGVLENDTRVPILRMRRFFPRLWLVNHPSLPEQKQN